jgi:hypothetical protein
MRDLDAPHVRTLERIRIVCDDAHDPSVDEKLDEYRGCPLLRSCSRNPKAHATRRKLRLPIQPKS